MKGWVCIHRGIQEHWIWQDPIKLKWWLDILMTVNHQSSKVNIGMQLYECQRGQTIMSLKSWADRWGVSKDSTRNFFELLKKDKMIHTENLVKTTRLTVCNYDLYQIDLHDEQTLSDRKPNAEQTQAETNNNDNNENNILSSKSSDSGPGENGETKKHIPYHEIIDLWNNTLCPPLSKVTKITDSRKKKIKVRFTEMGENEKGIETLNQLFGKIKTNKFLLGDGAQRWKATFDWVFENDSNWVKIMEDHYNGSPVNGKPQPELFTPKIPAL